MLGFVCVYDRPIWMGKMRWSILCFFLCCAICTYRRIEIHTHAVSEGKDMRTKRKETKIPMITIERWSGKLIVLNDRSMCTNSTRMESISTGHTHTEWCFIWAHNCSSVGCTLQQSEEIGWQHIAAIVVGTKWLANWIVSMLYRQIDIASRITKTIDWYTEACIVLICHHARWYPRQVSSIRSHDHLPPQCSVLIETLPFGRLLFGKILFNFGHGGHGNHGSHGNRQRSSSRGKQTQSIMHFRSAAPNVHSRKRLARTSRIDQFTDNNKLLHIKWKTGACEVHK